MANEAIERTVDGLIQSGRIPRDLREVYIRDMEAGLSDHLLRGSDYTKKTQELAEARRQFDAQVAQERQKLNERQQKLEGWYSNVQGDLQEYDRLKTTAAAYEQKLRDFNIYDEVEHPRQTVPTQRTPVDPRQNNIPDEKRPLTVEQANRFANDMLTLQSKMSRIQNEHFAVYGAPLPADEDLIAHFMKTGEDPEHYWRVKYNIEGKKQESIQRQRQEYEDKIRAEERAKVLSEVTSDPNRVVGGPMVLGRQGGVSPLLEAYAQSKATQHAQNGANQDLATGTVPKERVNPEQISEIPAALDRINSAANKFKQMFSDDGNPISDEGKAAFRKHFVSDVY